ncbi:MAG: peptidase [Lachnospiraceae bacterium]|nr:peptidase [Lachnospiraceae bacterium]
MKYRNGLVKKAAALLLGLAMTVANMTVVNAATAPDLDLTKTGSIALTLKDADGVTVSGGAVTAYEVAKLYLDDGNMAYAYTDGFGDCTVALDVTDTTLASSLVSYMSGCTITGTEKSVASDGTVSFTDLELGLYLIVQTIESADYETISPFVVTLPMEEDGVWVYAVNASPKVGTVTLTPEEPGEPEEPEEPTEPEEPVVPETPQTPAEPILPQTGQLNWPVPVLLIGGFILLIAGVVLKNSDKKNRRYAS